MIISDDELVSLLLTNKLADQKAVDGLRTYAANSDISLFDAIVERNILTDDNLGQLIAHSKGSPFITLSRLSIADDVLHIVPERMARRQKIIAFSRDADGIKVAMSDPTKTEILTAIQKKTGQKIIVYYATERDIGSVFYLYKKDLQKTIDSLLSDAISRSGSTAVDAPIAKIVDLLIDYAYQNRTSDVHVEPNEEESLVRFRIDGILHDMLSFPKNLHERIITRIKVLSKLRTDEHLSAQDGKMQIQLEEENLDIRVSILPIVNGEKCVMRLLSAKTRQLSLVDLGMNETDLKKVTKAFSRSYGMILSTGPTGSGKSTSIYAILKILNTREKNITTIEDPVEYRIKGVNQIQVNTKANLTFASGLRSILRQDPNVVFVGEIRDNETAAIAVNAALTGHLVLSTLHTNDAATALPRLIDMKVEPFLVASTVNVIIAQRLVRKICDMCRMSYIVTVEELSKHFSLEVIQKHYTPVGDLNEIRLYKGEGCRICHATGYNGRIAIFEVLEVNQAIRKLLIDKNDSDIIYQTAIKNGMATMLDDGLQKVAKGLTTMDEILRVTKVDV